MAFAEVDDGQVCTIHMIAYVRELVAWQTMSRRVASPCLWSSYMHVATYMQHTLSMCLLSATVDLPAG